MFRNHNAHLTGDRQGAIAIEFAFLAPVVMVMTIGIVNYAELTNYRMALDGAIRAAANVAVLSPPIGNDFSRIRDAFDYAAPANPNRTLTFSTHCECQGGIAIACNLGCADGSERQVLVTMTVSEDYQLAVPLPVFDRSLALTTDVTIRVS